MVCDLNPGQLNQESHEFLKITLECISSHTCFLVSYIVIFFFLWLLFHFVWLQNFRPRNKNLRKMGREPLFLSDTCRLTIPLLWFFWWFFFPHQFPSTFIIWSASFAIWLLTSLFFSVLGKHRSADRNFHPGSSTELIIKTLTENLVSQKETAHKL